MKLSVKLSAALLAFVMTVSLLSSCSIESLFGSWITPDVEPESAFAIDGEECRAMAIGGACLLEVTPFDVDPASVVWTVDGDAVKVDKYGLVEAVKEGVATVTARYGELFDRVELTVSSVGGENVISDPYTDMTKDEFYANYTPATDFIDAYYRTQHGFMSGELEIPDAAPKTAENRPVEDGLYVRNTDMRYEDNGNTYVVLDANGNVAFRVYRGAAYITLEEVAAYMFAFGGTDGAFPANYTSAKKTKPTASIWGEYLRVNHSYFSGDTVKYPREPELPNIMGCGGSLQYWEMDIGSTGYNNGSKITRGACRIVYGRNDLNRNGVYEQGELHVFYTYNHYDDFQEYLNYEGGWGEIFGFETNGSSSAKGPSPYVPIAYASLSARSVSAIEVYYYVPTKEWLSAA